MSRVVKKKVIDENLTFADDFDENMLDRIESELGKSMADGQQAGDKQRVRRPQSLDEAGSDESAGALPVRPGPMESDKLVAARDRPPRGSGTGGDREAKTPPWFRKTAVKRRAALGITLLLFVFLPAVAWVLIQRQHNAVPTIQFVRHPVPVPHHQLESQFLVLTSAGAKKDLVEMSVAFAFSNTGAFERFKDRQAAIHDSCYRFIQSHSPPDNSQKNWAKLVQEDLRAYLQTDFPRVRIDSITLVQFSRL